MRTVLHTKRVFRGKYAGLPEGSRPRRRSGLVVATTFLAFLGALATLPPIEAGATRPTSKIDDARAQARRLEAQIEANGERISMLAEQYNGVQLKLATLRRQLDEAARKAGLAKQEQRDLRSQLATRAAALYRGAGSTPLVSSLDADSVTEAGARSKYAEVASERDSDLIDRYGAARAALSEYSADLERQQAALATEQDRLESAKAEIERRNQEQNQLLSQVQGNLRRLIEEDRQRQLAAERAAAAAAIARLAAQRDDNSNDVTTPTTAPTDTGGGDVTTPTTVPTDTGGGTVVAPNPRAQTAVDAALAQVGTPYVYAMPRSWSDPDPVGFDCSGLTGWAWAKAGVILPHHSGTQYATLPKVSQADLVPGDLLFFGSPIHHVGMYIGGGMMVEAPHTGALVRTRSIFRSDYAGASRPG